MGQTESFYTWVVHNWAKASLLLAILLFLLCPFVWKGIGVPAVLLYLLLPVYMLHQYEEHARGGFKIFVNTLLGQGREILSDEAILWINLLGVWVAGLIVLYLAVYVNLAFGLISGYLVAFNGLTHVLMGLARRPLNPGFWTSLLVFLPLGGFTLFAITQASHAGWADHLLALGAAVLLHAGIVLYLRRQLVKA